MHDTVLCMVCVQHFVFDEASIRWRFREMADGCDRQLHRCLNKGVCHRE